METHGLRFLRMSSERTDKYVIAFRPTFYAKLINVVQKEV